MSNTNCLVWFRAVGAALDQATSPRLPGPVPGRLGAGWDDDRIRAELRTLLAGRTQWPTAGQFRAAGRDALWRAIKRSGGSDRWCLEFGVRRQHRRAGSHRVWTAARIETELRRLLAGLDRWPPPRVFREAGKASLYTAAYHYGGIDYWAARIGLERRSRRRPSPYWTEERIRDELLDFCHARSSWPTETDFAAAGRLPVYWAASRAGGMRRWKAELGFIATARPEAA